MAKWGRRPVGRRGRPWGGWLALASVIVSASTLPAPSPVGASPAGPPKVVVLGDSTALTLGYALAATAPSGTAVTNAGLFGCGLAIASYASNDPPNPGLAMVGACNSSTPPDQRWPALDAQAVADTGPGDQVLFLAGAWDTQDLYVYDQWTSILSSPFRRYLLGQMEKAVLVATAHGAHLDFLTMPCMDPGYEYGQPPGPTFTQHRRTLFNDLIHETAKLFPTKVSVIAYGKLLCPTGTFAYYLNGVQVRSPDGIHTPAYAPGNIFANNASKSVAHKFYVWLRPRLWPRIIAKKAS